MQHLQGITLPGATKGNATRSLPTHMCTNSTHPTGTSFPPSNHTIQQHHHLTPPRRTAPRRTAPQDSGQHTAHSTQHTLECHWIALQTLSWRLQSSRRTHTCPQRDPPLCCQPLPQSGTEFGGRSRDPRVARGSSRRNCEGQELMRTVKEVQRESVARRMSSLSVSAFCVREAKVRGKTDSYLRRAIDQSGGERAASLDQQQLHVSGFRALNKHLVVSSGIRSFITSGVIQTISVRTFMRVVGALEELSELSSIVNIAIKTLPEWGGSSSTSTSTIVCCLASSGASCTVSRTE